MPSKTPKPYCNVLLTRWTCASFQSTIVPSIQILSAFSIRLPDYLLAIVRIPANSGPFVRLQEISGSIRLRGGLGRIRTSNQTVMSAPMWRHAHFDLAEFLDATVVLTNEMANDWRRSFPAIASTAPRMCAGW